MLGHHRAHSARQTPKQLVSCYSFLGASQQGPPSPSTKGWLCSRNDLALDSLETGRRPQYPRGRGSPAVTPTQEGARRTCFPVQICTSWYFPEGPNKGGNVGTGHFLRAKAYLPQRVPDIRNYFLETRDLLTQKMTQAHVNRFHARSTNIPGHTGDILNMPPPPQAP